MRQQEFKEQIAIVTGGNSGIGKAISIDLARKGAKVMLFCRNKDRNEETKNEIAANGDYAEAFTVDVSDKSSVDEAMAFVSKKYGRIDILICNAGNLVDLNHTLTIPISDFDSVVKTHVYGTLYCVQACGALMKERSYGRIVLMSSLGGYHGMAANVAYAVSKHGLLGMMYSLAKELGPHGITVNAVLPGVISTPMCDPLIAAAGEQFILETPVRKIGQPEDVADAVTFLCNPKSGFITGVPLRVDGGYMIDSGMDRLAMSVANSK